MLDNERSAQGKVMRDSVRDFCPALIVRHRARYQMMEQRSSHRKSREWFFFFVQVVVVCIFEVLILIFVNPIIIPGKLLYQVTL